MQVYIQESFSCFIVPLTALQCLHLFLLPALGIQVKLHRDSHGKRSSLRTDLPSKEGEVQRDQYAH